MYSISGFLQFYFEYYIANLLSYFNLFGSVPLTVIWSVITGKAWDNIYFVLLEWITPYLYFTKIYTAVNYGAWFGVPLEGNM